MGIPIWKKTWNDLESYSQDQNRGHCWVSPFEYYIFLCWFFSAVWTFVHLCHKQHYNHVPLICWKLSLLWIAIRLIRWFRFSVHNPWWIEIYLILFEFIYNISVLSNLQHIFFKILGVKSLNTMINNIINNVRTFPFIALHSILIISQIENFHEVTPILWWKIVCHRCICG